MAARAGRSGRGLLAALIWLVSAAMTGQPGGLDLQQQLNELLAWFPGEYDNHQQVYREAVEKLPQDQRHRQTHHIFAAVDIPALPGRLISAQQSQHYDRSDIYRQRIYSFTVDEAAGAIKLTIYTPKDPARLRGLHLEPNKARTMTADDFILKPGCEVYWTRKDDGYHGYLKKNACSYYSTSFKTQVYLNETLILRPDALLLDDSAVDGNGKPVFGVHDKGPTVNLKEKPGCEGLARPNPS